MGDSANIYDFLNRSAREFPDMDAIVHKNGKWTFAQLNDRVNRLANAMKNMGVSKGDHVGIFATNCNQCVEVLFAAAKLGAVLVPFNYRLKEKEAFGLFHHSEITTIFFSEPYRRLMDTLLPRLPSIGKRICFEAGDENYQCYEDLLSNATNDEPEVNAGGGEVALILYTSGTTDFPKGVMLSHDHIVTRIKTRDMDLLKMPAGGVSLLTLPNYHTGGIQGILKNVHRPMTLVIMEQFETVEFMETVAREKVQAATLVPTMIRRLVDHPDRGNYDLSSLKQIRYGTAPMYPDLLMEAMKAFPNCSFTQGYGMTEGSATTLSVEDHRLEGPPDDGKKLKRLRSVGKAIKDVSIKITGKDDSELPTGEVGKILIKGPALLTGYWKEPADSPDVLKNGWLDTGDLGFLDEDGYLFIAGRQKDIIIRGGENIAPVEIEAVLESHPAVREAAVIGVPDLEWGEVVRAIVVPGNGAEVSEEEIIKFCGEKLASYKKPASVVWVDSLPKNPIGKVLKRVLREQYGAERP